MTNKLMFAAILALLSTAPALAQESPAALDSRWTPYVGCWTIVQDQYGQSAPVPAGTMVCVRPSGRFGVAVTTTVDGKNVLEQTIVADGSPQPLSKADCTGTYISNWSRDGERLFTRVELECANGPKRNVSGITLLANDQWIDAQATVVDGNSDVRVRRYRRASDPSTTVPAAAAAPLSIEDVIEGNKQVQSEALEAALYEVNQRFPVDRQVLTQLADNGVSRSVIDLMVAQAYPEKFQVDRDVYASMPSTSATASYGGGASIGSSSVYMGSSAYPFPMYDPFYSSYYYYSPFAYPYYWGPYYSYRLGSPYYRNYYNYNNYYGFPGSGNYYGGGSSGSSGGNALPGSPDSAGGNGVVVNGRGYTRVRPSGSSNSSGGGDSATPTSRSPSSTRGVRSVGGRSSGNSSGSSGTASSGSSSSSSSGSSGSSGASSGGNSSGSTGGSSSGGGGGGRTAQPR
jgi:hypothetical protein